MAKTMKVKCRSIKKENANESSSTSSDDDDNDEIIVLDENSSSRENSISEMEEQDSEIIIDSTNHSSHDVNLRKRRITPCVLMPFEEPPAKKKSSNNTSLNEEKNTLVDELRLNERLKHLPLLPLKYFYYYKTSNDLCFINYIKNEYIDSNIINHGVFDLISYHKHKPTNYYIQSSPVILQTNLTYNDNLKDFIYYSKKQYELFAFPESDFKQSFYINSYSFDIDIDDDEELSEFDLKRTEFYLYESVKHFRTYQKASYTGNLNTRGDYNRLINNRFDLDYNSPYGIEYKDLVKFIDRDLYLFSLTTNTKTKEITTKLNKIDIDKSNEFNRVLITLTSNNSIYMKIKSIDVSESEQNSLAASKNYPSKKLRITVDLYLNNKHLLTNINENPSILTRNNSSMDMHYLMTYFFFSKQLSSIHLHPSKIDESKIIDKNNNENFFDIVHDLHNKDKSISEITDYEYDHIKQLSNLRPMLRPYQVKAIKWMLRRENFNLNSDIDNIQEESDLNDNDDNLHELYSKVTNKLGQTIYYHKYYGLYSLEKPLKLKSENGGILADEMGLGKTVEILALISINQCKDYKSDENGIQSILNDKDFVKSIKLAKENSFSCICNKAPERFATNNLQELTNRTRKSSKTIPKIVESLVYRCRLCKVYTHVDCVNYKGEEDDFLCMFCSTKIPTIKSKATLVVTPSIISHQWADEIKKHVDKNLKILIYTGTSNGFVQPRDLAKLDIVITTYDVLSQELSHVFAIENKRQLRNVSRYMTIPSPINCLRWWRIVLDEAQMVHSTNSKCAEMAHRLDAVNRWCVTGTPIGRSLTDLHGLFVFIREDPYNEKKWFNEQLFEPYIHNDRMPMAKAVSKVLWRSSKRHVSNQIEIPVQTEKIYWLNFSPFEQHLYDRVREIFREKRKVLFHNTNNENENYHARNRDLQNVIDLFETCAPYLKLDELDRNKLSQLLSPILDLRLTCNHPQLILRKRTFMAQTRNQDQNKLLTMEKSLEMLLKKTQTECDNLYRTMIMHRNALAGIHIIMHEYDKAIDTYQKVIDSERLDYEYHVKLDLLQKIHAYYNYVQVLKIKLNKMIEGEENNNSISQKDIEEKIKKLEYNLIDYEKVYSISFDESKSKDENKMKEKINEVNKNLKKLQKSDKYHEWWLEILRNIETSTKERKEEFWNKINYEFGSAASIIIDQDSLSYSICGKSVKTFNELKVVIVEEMDKLFKYRENLLEKLNVLTTNDHTKTNQIVQKAADCHLRRDMLISNIINKKGFNKKKKEYKQLFEAPKCDLCLTDNSFKTYVKHLFSNKNDIIKSSRYDSDEDVTEDENLRNDFEYGDLDEEEAEFENKQLESAMNRSDLEKFLKLIHFMGKHEKSTLKDDIETGKEFLQFFSSLKEEFKLMRKFYTKSSNQINALDELEMCKLRMRLLQPNEKNIYELDYIIEENQINGEFYIHNNSSIESESELKRKLGQLHYLKNLQKTFLLEEGKENEEPCPICMQNIGYSWYVLPCGHSFCVDCFKDLVKNECDYLGKLKCALCRVVNPRKEACLVSTKKDENEKEISSQKQTPAVCSKNSDNSIYKNNYADELTNIKIKGNCNSAKVEGIVKCLHSIIRKDKTAKILIFSEHLTILELIIDLIKDNFIFYRYIKDSQSLHKNINLFKTDPGINVLLMPYSFGANGLNIIEATHVILTEPTLNKSQEIQAIGRIHRIGQTKPTFVHRFLIRDSIEELVYRLFKSSSSYSDNQTSNVDPSKPNCSKNFNKIQDEQEEEEKALTMADIKNLFLNL